MPEGDSIYRMAGRIDRALGGMIIERFEADDPRLRVADENRAIAGRRLERAFAVGKNLVLGFSGDLLLRTHLKMHGRWRVVPSERSDRTGGRRGRIVVASVDWAAVGWSIPVAEIQTWRAFDRWRVRSNLGPDLLDPAFSIVEASMRLRQRGGEIGDALLDQRCLTGIGNVFKSEVLFQAGVDPFRGVETLTEDELTRTLEAARRLLEENVVEVTGPIHGNPRQTTRRMDPAERLFVYGRAGRACRRCGGSIEGRKQGPNARWTWRCTDCQH